MRQDVKLTDDYDVAFWNGDLDVGPSDFQEAELLVYGLPGDWRHAPLAGAGLRRGQNAPLTESLARRVRLQLEADGLQVEAIVQQGDSLAIKLRNEGV